MNAPTFTPGPWIVQLATQDGPYIKGGDERIDGEPQTVVAEVYPVTDTGGTEMANARLIAAAPDLLEAVKGLQAALTEYRLRDVKKRFSLCVADAAASTAVAKAEGSAD